MKPGAEKNIKSAKTRLDSLPKLVRTFPDHASEKIELFGYFQTHFPRKGRALTEITDAALFAKAFPDDSGVNYAADQLLSAARKVTAEIVNNASRKESELLESSGLIHTALTARFSYGLTLWLSQKFPENISFHSFEGNTQLMRVLLQKIVSPVEADLLSEDTNELDACIRQSGSINQAGLDALLTAIENHHPDNLSRSQTFDMLQIFIQVRFGSGLPDRSSIFIPEIETSFQRKPLQKSFNTADFKNLIRPKKITLSGAELTRIAKLSLLSLGKETDPITWSDLRHAELFDCGDGMQIGLFQLLPEWRLPLEAYIGYMAFKNGMPFSYGGAWCLGKTAQIGINIYETFRGGESAWMLAKLMHLYHCEYGTEKFRVEPYQLGYDNEDGLQSGVFWFYYRMGFRPENPGLVKLAEKEWNKIQKDKNYHSSLKTLQELASDYMFLQIGIKQKEKNAEEINQNTLKWIEKNKSKGRQNLTDITYRFLVDHQLYSKKQWDTMPAELQRGILQSAMFLQSNPVLLKKVLRNPELLKKMWNEKLRGNEKLFCKIWNQLFNDL